MTAAMTVTTAPTPEIEFCDELLAIDRLPFTVGRDADLVLEAENRHLHRRFLTIDHQHGVWWTPGPPVNSDSVLPTSLYLYFSAGNGLVSAA